MATLCEEKGVLDLFEAIAIVAQEVPDVTVTVAGTWRRESDELQAQRVLAIRNIGDRVRFVGAVEGHTKVKLMREASVLALPSKFPFEAQPLVILDAYSAATPVVVSRIGTTPDIVDDGVEGYVVAQGDIICLADALVTILADTDLRSRMGAAARRRYELAHREDAFAERLSAVWENAQ